MAAFTTQANQALLDKYFGAGKVVAGGGGGEAALANASPAIRNGYLADRQQYDGQQGYQLSPANPSANPYNGGVSPVGQVEPLNQWQQTALQNQFNGAPSQGFENGIQGAFQGLQGAVQNLPTSMTPGQFQSLYQQYMNPYQQDVVNATNNTIQRQADIMKNPIKEQQAGNNSFGSTAQGVENGQIDNAALQAITNSTAGLNSAGYQSSVGNALSTNQQNYNQAVGKVGAFGSLIGAGIQGNQNNQQNFAQNTQNQLSAGNQVQNQNQNLLNVVNGQISGVQQYPYTQLSNFSNLLSPYTGSTGASYNYSPSQASQLGGLGLFGASNTGQSLFSNLFNTGSSGGALGLQSGFLGMA